RLIVDRLDEPVAERVERRAEGAHFEAARHALLNVRIDRAVVDQRPAGRRGKAVAVEMTRTELRNLTDAADDRSLVALGARLRVVDRTETFGDAVAFLKGVEGVVEFALIHESIGDVVEAGRGFVGGTGNPG